MKDKTKIKIFIYDFSNIRVIDKRCLEYNKPVYFNFSIVLFYKLSLAL